MGTAIGTFSKRIAINAGGPYVSGLNAVVAGAVLAAHELAWEIVGIRDGFDGILFPDRYPGGGLLKLTPDRIAGLTEISDAHLGTSHTNPFRVRTVQKYEDNMEGIEEIDRSDELLAAMKKEQIDGLISVVGRRAMSISWKLAKKNGLRTLCVPESVENDMATTLLSFGFNTTLSFAIELLDQLRTAARASRRIAVAEVLGEHAGWLALQAGIAASADAVLIPEIPYDLAKVAERLKQNQRAGRSPTLIVVAEGARSIGVENQDSESEGTIEGLRRALSPGSSSEATSGGTRVIDRSGVVAEAVAREIQRRCDYETFPFILNQVLRGGRTTPTDRQLGMTYGAAAVSGLHNGRSGELVAFQPEMKYVPLIEALNKIRTVLPDSQFIVAARALGIALGD
jgi:6-phosphofructokinase